MENKPSIFSKISRLSQFSRRTKIAVFVIVFAVLGAAIVYFSGANQINLATSTDPSDVILEYSLPHQNSPVSAGLQTPLTPPFVLYGNGLLVCGHPTATPFALNSYETVGYIPQQATATTLNQSQIASLVQQIVNSGFLSLNQAYYKFPVDELETDLTLSLLSGQHNVAYFGDVTPPPAYTAILSVLQQTCANVTQSYISLDSVVRTKRVPPPNGEPVLQQYNLGSTATVLQPDLSKSDQAPATGATGNATATVSLNEANQRVSTSQARDTLNKLGGRAQGYVQFNGSIYEVNVDQPLPKARNLGKVGFVNSNHSGGGVMAWLKNKLAPSANAAGTIPIRYVIVQGNDQPASAGTDRVNMLNNLGSAVRDWYCSPKVVGSCYNFTGVSIVRGSQSVAYYNTCHDSSGCNGGDTLLTFMDNVATSDPGIARTDVDTIIVPAWQTNGLAHNACGYAFVSGDLGAVDEYQPANGYNVNPSAGTVICQRGHDIAHETGHTFGLNHTCNNTLMDGLPQCQYANWCDIGVPDAEPLCNLDAGQAAQLKTESQFFNIPGVVGGGSGGSLGLVPVYRVYDGGTTRLPYLNTEQYSNSFSAAQSYIYNHDPGARETVMDYISSTTGQSCNFSSVKPIYNLTSPAGAQLLTTTTGEEQLLISYHHYTYNGIFGYDSPSQCSGMDPLYRLDSPFVGRTNPYGLTIGNSFYTTNSTDIPYLQSLGYKLVGTLGYVWKASI